MRRLFRRLWYIVTWRRQQAELAEEMDFHRRMKERDLLAAAEKMGEDPDDIAIRARRELGNVALAQDEARDAWLWPGLQNLLQDVRFALRILTKDVQFTASAVLALALGIAVNTTTFSIINTAVLRDLPFDEPDRLVSIGTRDSRGQNGGVSLQDLNDWRTAGSALAGIAAYSGGALNLSDDSQAPERTRGGAFVSASTFGLLRVQPIVGRDFIAEDDRPGAAPVVILGYGLWQRRYGGDKSVVGRTIRVNDVPSMVVGIMPEHFRFPFAGDVWQPLALAPVMRDTSRDRRLLQVFGRLADSRTMGQARAELEGIAAQLAARHPETNKGVTARVEGMNEFRLVMMPILMTLMAFVLFVLLIACANVANLLLARSSSRSREIAIRASLGATRWRIVRQLLVECGMVALLAGSLGLMLSVYGIRYLGSAFAGREIGAPASSAVMPYWVDLSMNELVFVFVGGLCVLTTLLSGLAPALHVAKANTNDLLKEGGRGGGAGLRMKRWTSGFMIAQIAMTIVLLTSAGLMLRTFVTLYRADRVIDTSGMVTARLSFSASKYAAPEARRRFLERLDLRLASSPMFSGATMATGHPFNWTGSTRRVALDESMALPDEDQPTVGLIQADGRYFDVLGLRMVRGRSFVSADAEAGREGVVIDQRLAEMLFPGRDPVGRRIRLIDDRRASPDLRVIVGVTPTIPYNLEAGDEARPVVFAPLWGGTTPSALSIIVRSRSDMAGALSQLRDEVRGVDPNLPIYYAQTLEEAFGEARYALRLIGGWFGGLALIAVILAAVGLFAITSHAVGQRTQEIGVRIALGARNREVVWLFLRRTLAQLVLGTTIGMAGAFAVGQLLQNWIARTHPRDPLTLAGVMMLIVLVAFVATLLPARRATRIDPLVALRYE